MRKNLVISCVGPNSLHKSWLKENRNFDLLLYYYGDVKNLYKEDADCYFEKKGTKFNIIADLDLANKYEYIFVPDDDLLMDCDDINRLFDLAKKHDLWVCQPSIMGYYSVHQTLHHPGCVLRYTNWVEIMCPCFSNYAFEVCQKTFNYSKSCWGVEKLWNKKLGNPKDKIAIIDDVIAQHTRPCFAGDNYTNNNIEKPENDLFKVIKDNDLGWDIKIYSKLDKDISSLPHDMRHYPPIKFFQQRKLF
jgi:hypothetical protein